MGFLDYLWSWVQSFFYGKSGRLVLIGLDNAGKTSTLTRLSTGRMSNPLPTNHTKMQEVVVGNLTASVFDVGGHQLARRLWKDYLVAVDAIVFIVDSADRSRMAEAKAELTKVLQDTTSLPVLVLANKQDVPSALNEPDLRDLLSLHLTSGKQTSRTSGTRSIELFPCSVLRDRGLVEGFTWLSKQL